jgi:hypothetical protein
MRLPVFIGLLLVLVAGLALGCGQSTSTTSVTAATVTTTPTAAASTTSTTASPTAAATSTSAIAVATTTHNRLTDPTYPNVTTTEDTSSVLDAPSQRVFVEPYIPFVQAMGEKLSEAAYEEDEDLPFGMGGFGFIVVYDDKAQEVVLETPVSFGDYVKFRDVYDERAWKMTRAVAAFYIDDEYVDLLKGNPLPPWRLSVDGIVYEVPARVMTGIARSEVSKEDWLRTTGR